MLPSARSLPLFNIWRFSNLDSACVKSYDHLPPEGNDCNESSPIVCNKNGLRFFKCGPSKLVVKMYPPTESHSCVNYKNYRFTEVSSFQFHSMVKTFDINDYGALIYVYQHSYIRNQRISNAKK